YFCAIVYGSNWYFD
nr:immunoglobulin heavy chain junction region [Mus musculus]